MKKLTRFISVLLVIAMLLGVMAACAKKEEPAPAPTEPEQKTRTITDATGEEVEVPVDPQKIVVAPVVLPNMVYAMMGTTDKMIAIPKGAYTGYEISIMADMEPAFKNVNTTMVNGSMEVNLEELAKSGADLVIFWDSNAEQAKQVREMGICAACVKSAKNMATLRELITMLGQILNCEERANKILGWYDSVDKYIATKSDALKALTDEQKPKVIQVGYVEKNSLYNTGIDAKLIEAVGGKNIDVSAGKDSSSNEITMENIYKFDPDIIILSNWDEYVPADLYNGPVNGVDWTQLTAVKEGHVYKCPMALYRWTPPNCTEKPLYELYLASLIQPEIFSDLDMEKEVQEFFTILFDYKLSADQMAFIMHTEANSVSK